MAIPLLTSYQTLDTAKGTLDPLGLYTIADRLALRLAPGLRERMKHPRYLTAIAVGSVVCSAFDEEELAIDEVSQPWQVYEWYVTSALVKRFLNDNKDQLLGLPSREKTTRAYKDGFPLSANRYLKTPSVYGFHGVYRTFAKDINLIDRHNLGEFGARLVEAWENEQNLYGFSLGKQGTPGGQFRKKLTDAVKEGLELGRVAKAWNWNVLDQIADTLAPKSAGKREADLLYGALSRSTSPLRAELVNFLNSDEGLNALDSGSEKEIHTEFLKQASASRELLLAIQAYEKFARNLHNAFYAALKYMEKRQSKGVLNDLKDIPEVIKCVAELDERFKDCETKLESFIEEASLFAVGFTIIRQKGNTEEWLRLMFDHHFKVQKNKPPKGKSPWLLESGKAEYLLNTELVDDFEFTDEYVHQYRSYSIKSFLKDLGKISTDE